MKKIFSYNPDIDKNAYMNWTTDRTQPRFNFILIAEGYFKAAISLAESCLSDNMDKKADLLIFPMLFTIDHAIELYEKSLCWSMNILLGYNSTFKSNHDIRGNWFTVKNKIKEYGFGYGREENEFNKMIIGLEAYIDELSNLIKNDDNINDAYRNIDFCRYPLNNRNEDHFYLRTYENVVVDLENFVDVVNQIGNSLQRLAEYYYYLSIEKQGDDL